MSLVQREECSFEGVSGIEEPIPLSHCQSRATHRDALWGNREIAMGRH